jgi:hypothetical protein
MSTYPLMKVYPGDIEKYISQMGAPTHECPKCHQPYWSDAAQCRGYHDVAIGKKYPHDKVKVITVVRTETINVT